MTNYNYRVDVPRLRRSLFGGHAHKVPALCNDSWSSVGLWTTNGKFIGMFTIKVVPSSTIGSQRKSNWKGTGKHRMHVKCKCCEQFVPAGRLGQHMAYKHKEVK